MSCVFFDQWVAALENLPWAKCVERYDRRHTLFFCDPPYWEAEGYGVDFPLQEYERLAAAARPIQGKMIITVNDHPVMRQVFEGLPMTTVGITYAIGSLMGLGIGRRGS